MEPETRHPYGRCPICGAPGITRERRPNGDDRCANKHQYPSRTALDQPVHEPAPSALVSIPATTLEKVEAALELAANTLHPIDNRYSLAAMQEALTLLRRCK